MTFKKNDQNKLRHSLFPVKALEDILECFELGAEKYGSYNWKACETPTRYLDAALRHISAHRKGERMDIESDLPPLAHAICSLIILMELER